MAARDQGGVALSIEQAFIDIAIAMGGYRQALIEATRAVDLMRAKIKGEWSRYQMVGER